MLYLNGTRGFIGTLVGASRPLEDTQQTSLFLRICFSLIIHCCFLGERLRNKKFADNCGVSSAILSLFSWFKGIQKMPLFAHKVTQVLHYVKLS